MARIPQEILDLYDEFTHGPMGRRVFLERLAGLAGGTAAATTLLPLLQNNYALAAMIPENDTRVIAEMASFQAPGGAMKAYVAKPAAPSGKLPAVIVIHENRGLNPHIRDVTRRMALEGFVAVGVDMLSAGGGETPADEDKARDMIGALDAKQTIANALAAAEYARSGRPDATGKVGVIGFCWGGGLVNQMAVNDPKLNAAVAFYGRQAAAADVPKIKSPLLLHYAGLDQGINAGIQAYVDALKAAGAKYEMHMYDGVNHAFNNDTNAARYDEKAAKLAWQRTVDFLKANLKG